MNHAASSLCGQVQSPEMRKAGKACTNGGMQEERTHTCHILSYACTNYISKFGMRDERLVASTSPNHFATIVARAGLFADSWPIAFVCWFAVTIPCTRSMYCARRAVAASTLSAI